MFILTVNLHVYVLIHIGGEELYRGGSSAKEIAKFLVPDFGGYSRLWHRVALPARQSMSPGGPVQQPYAGVDYIPRSGTKNLAYGMKDRVIYSALFSLIKSVH